MAALHVNASGAEADNDGDKEVLSRIAALDWPQVTADLHEQGWATLGALLTPGQCESVADLYSEEDRFRSTIVMARHGFGRGEYKYFAYPLPRTVSTLRHALYSRLAPVADNWNLAMNIADRFPATLPQFLERCRQAGQTRPTPLLLRYGPGDYNSLHQDLYGAHVFPLQVAILLSEPDVDFTGGEFVLTEQRPRRQSRPAVAPLRKGDAVVFAVHYRPVQGVRGIYRAMLRHGVSTVRSGRRQTAGVIFHDAQ